MKRSIYLLPWIAGGILASAMLFSAAIAANGGAAAYPPEATAEENGGILYPGGEEKIKNKNKCLWRKEFLSTTYGPPWNSIEGGPETAMGTPLYKGRYVIAVDPRVIPLGSRVKVWPNPHNYRGVFLAEDVGGAIKGRHVDVFVWQGPEVRDYWFNRSTTVCLVKRG